MPTPSRVFLTHATAFWFDSQVERARGVAKCGQLHRAMRLLDDILRQSPGHPCAKQLRDELRLLESREKRRAQNPRDPRAHLELGFSYLRLDRNREAAEALHTAARMAPNLYLAHLLLGIAMHRLGRGSDARSAYRRASKLRPDDRTHLDLLDALEKGLPPDLILVEEPPTSAAGPSHPRLPRARAG